MTDPTIFNQLIVWPIINMWVAVLKPLQILGIPGAMGFSIILLTILIKILLYPLSKKQIASAQKMQQLKPEIAKIQAKHKDKKRQQEEQLKLFKKHGINPVAGCLPTLLQLPILIGLYQVFLQILNNGDFGVLVGQINKVLYFPVIKISTLNPEFFGISLGTKPSEWQSMGIWLLVIPVVTAGLSYYQTQLMTDGAISTTDPDANKNKKAGEEDFGTSMQKQMKFMFPLMLGWISYAFPLGLTLYWNTFAAFGILQQVRVKREFESK